MNSATRRGAPSSASRARWASAAPRSSRGRPSSTRGSTPDGTLGLSLLDLFDHWVFGYGLMICGLLECVLVGWVYDIDKVIAHINETSFIKLGNGYKVMIRFVVPAIVLFILVSNIVKELADGIYGTKMDFGGMSFLWVLALVGWLALTLIGAWVLTGLRGAEEGA
ncbi:MAG: hypothetical protein M5R36_06685 [Deltaproteobacteria bacterium]|nr:hypothetical protein [Deltaproteobacteria bacterium]